MTSPDDDLALVRRFLERGRAAVRVDARHLVFWGLTLAGGLALQYPAEVLDWAPSAVLWIWQPLAVLIWAGRLAATRGERTAGDPARLACRSAFAAAAAAVLASYAGALSGGVPDGHDTVLVACAGAGVAFAVVGALSGRRSAWAASAAWGALLVWFAWKGRLTPGDFLVLAGACAALLAGPGLLLSRPARSAAPSGVFA